MGGTVSPGPPVGPVGVRFTVPLLESEGARGSHAGRLFLAPPELPLDPQGPVPSAKKTGLRPEGTSALSAPWGKGGQGWERTRCFPTWFSRELGTEHLPLSLPASPLTMPAGVPWTTYLKMFTASLLAMFAGSQVVHRYYLPDLVSAGGPWASPSLLPTRAKGIFKRTRSASALGLKPDDGVQLHGEQCHVLLLHSLAPACHWPYLTHFRPFPRVAATPASLLFLRLIKPLPT